FRLAAEKTGALLVLVRNDSITELMDGTIELAANISPEILEAIFQKNSPLHDGAAVIDGDQIVYANAVLPLTQRADLPVMYGTRHRAAMGLTELSDAIVIAVSEERG
ncbi:MAG: diadenylate cyclase, partial [Bryobacteraceae bacterium]|nr:diadenylate cyclase [Bryobacteraceae bacterium]